MAPFPFRSITTELDKYKNASVEWVQEEPKNQGGWYFAQPRLANILKSLKRKPEVSYAGRAPSASTATGYGKFHD